MKRVLFYVQHLLGVGHLARASRIAQALIKHRFDVTMVIGGMPVPGFPGPNIEVLELPPVRASDEGFSQLVDIEGRQIDDTFKSMRREKLLSLFGKLNPDVVLIEAFPFGRRQMRFELLPLLNVAYSKRPRPLIAASIRDILQEKNKPGRAEETVDLVRSRFDLVLVHGDPGFNRLEETFPLVPAIAEQLVYTGLVAGPEPILGQKYNIIVSAGGGAAGELLIKTALEASRTSQFGSWCILTGPNLKLEPGLLPDNVSLFSFRPDFTNLLAAADVSVSQSGYNTVCDLLRARCRAVLVPFASKGESEQTRRAAALALNGLADVIEEAKVDPVSLNDAIATALKRPRPQPTSLNLDGAATTASILQMYLDRRKQN